MSVRPDPNHPTHTARGCIYTPAQCLPCFRHTQAPNPSCPPHPPSPQPAASGSALLLMELPCRGSPAESLGTDDTSLPGMFWIASTLTWEQFIRPLSPCKAASYLRSGENGGSKRRPPCTQLPAPDCGRRSLACLNSRSATPCECFSQPGLMVLMARGQSGVRAGDSSAWGPQGRRPASS